MPYIKVVLTRAGWRSAAIFRIWEAGIAGIASPPYINVQRYEIFARMAIVAGERHGRDRKEKSRGWAFGFGCRLRKVCFLWKVRGWMTIGDKKIVQNAQKLGISSKLEKLTNKLEIMETRE